MPRTSSPTTRPVGRPSSSRPSAARKPVGKIKQKSVGAVILNPDNQVLIMYSSANKYWEFPKGKVERGEKELDTLKREVYEETGIRRFRLHPSFRESIYYSFRVTNAIINKVVIYYLFKTGAKVQVSDEHVEYKWVTLDEVDTYLKHVNQKNLVKRVRAFMKTHEI